MTSNLAANHERRVISQNVGMDNGVPFLQWQLLCPSLLDALFDREDGVLARDAPQFSFGVLPEGAQGGATQPTDLVELGFLGNVIPVDLPDLPVLLLLVNLDDFSVCRLPPCLHITAVVGLEDVVQCLGGLL